MSTLAAAARMWLTRSIRPFVFTNQNDRKLSYSSEVSLGLYLHIPFCRTLCSFCPYCKEVYDPQVCTSYMDALRREIALVCSGQPVRDATSLYIGGGTPILAQKHLDGVLAELRQHFRITEGIGIELHPKDVTISNLQRLKDLGITKISIGVQSFQPASLKLLGRSQEDFRQMFQALQAVPFETVSMDFIFALPGQRMEDVLADLETAFANGANYAAIYPFIDFTFADNPFGKLSARETHLRMDAIADYCQERGYVRDSIWTFRKDAGASYSSMTRQNFLGFGCSATTLLRDQFKINTFSVEDYIRRVDAQVLPSALTCRFTQRQRMIYFLFWMAYSTHVDRDAFEDFFGKTLSSQYGLEFWTAEKLGWIQREGRGYRLTKKGAFYFHYFENDYTLAYIDKMWGLMRETPFPESMRL